MVEEKESTKVIATPENGAWVEGEYRYQLWRTWDWKFKPVVFVMLNPSTADATEDDPTIRRCVAYAKAWGRGGLVVANVFALRATNPSELERHENPVGPLNNDALRYTAGLSDLVVCAWGSKIPSAWGGQADFTWGLLKGAGAEPQMLRLNQDGQPAHPLYLPRGLTPQPYRPRAIV